MVAGLKILSRGILAQFILAQFWFKFSAENNGEPQHMGGGTDLWKFAITWQSLHFGKISEMNSISKPPLPIEIYTLSQNLSPDDYRKEDSM
jgi:hypothetical protein